LFATIISCENKTDQKLDKQFEQAKDLIQDSMQMINGKFAKGQDKTLGGLEQDLEC